MMVFQPSYQAPLSRVHGFILLSLTWFGTDADVDSSDQAQSLSLGLGVVAGVVAHMTISLILARVIVVIVLVRDNVVPSLLGLGTYSPLARSYHCDVLAIATLIDELLVLVCLQGRELSIDECCRQALT